MIPALDAEMTAVHRHTSTCLEGRHFLGVPIIHGPPSPFPPPPLSLPCFPVRQGDVPHGAAPSVCRLILNFSATAVGFLSRRSGLKIVRRLSLFSLSTLSPPSHRYLPPLSSGPQTRTWAGSFPRAEPLHRPRCARRVGEMKLH